MEKSKILMCLLSSLPCFSLFAAPIVCPSVKYLKQAQFTQFFLDKNGNWATQLLPPQHYGTNHKWIFVLSNKDVSQRAKNRVQARQIAQIALPSLKLMKGPLTNQQITDCYYSNHKGIQGYTELVRP